jgi:hypothetical protein
MKLKQKLGDMKITPPSLDQCDTSRSHMLRELYFESRGEVDTEMPKPFEGKWQDRIGELKAKNEKFEINLKKLRDEH